jgi:transposase
MKEEYAAWMSLDWADERHEICLQVRGSERVERFKVKQNPAEFHAWLTLLRKRVDGGKVAVAVEQRRGAVVYALMSHEFLQIFPINTTSISNYRKSLRASGAKDDPFDADLLLKFLQLHIERLRCLLPEDAQTRELKELTENRRKVVDKISAISNEMTSLLKTYYPQALEMFSEIKSALACDFLKKWPTFEKLLKAKPEQLRKFYTMHNSRVSKLIEARTTLPSRSRPLTTDHAILSPSVLLMEGLRSQMRILLELQNRFDLAIDDLFNKHPDKSLYQTLPGAGPALAPRLAAAMGKDRNRFEAAVEIQQLSGIAPVTKSSGKRRIVQWRWACPKFLRQTFQEFALHSIASSTWARAYYDQQIAKGKAHQAAIRALAYKWIRIIYRCWKDRLSYDEKRYLQALKRQNSRLIKFLPTKREILKV